MSERKYMDQGLEDSLRRAFVDKRFPSILFDGHTTRNRFLMEGLQFGIDKEWLQIVGEVKESQYTAVSYGLTEEGKKYFGLKK